jgi:SOS-response transcriptional repressor LexA
LTGECIYSDDIIVIDRAVTAANNRIVVARIGEDFTLKRLQIMQNRKTFLKPENPNTRPLKSLRTTTLKFGVL